MLLLCVCHLGQEKKVHTLILKEEKAFLFLEHFGSLVTRFFFSLH